MFPITRQVSSYSLIVLIIALFIGSSSTADAIPGSGGTDVRGTPSIAHIEVVSVSPRDVAASPSDVFDEVASGLSVVGVGKKVYLEGQPEDGAIVTGYVWELILQPGGSTATLSSTLGQLITLRPDVRGTYHVQLTPLDQNSNATEPVVQVIRAGTWVGAGTFNTDEPPDPTIPECANACCHGESNVPRLNVVDEWLGSNHANTLQAHLAGERLDHFAVSCLPCHTLGFDQTPQAINHGFDDIAADLGFDLSQIPTWVTDAFNNGVDNFPLLPVELQGHASVQCESCHGPGSEHLGNLVEADHGIAGVSLDIDQCAQCHDSASGFQQQFYQWGTSAHPVTADVSEGHVVEITSCLRCHTGEGFVENRVNGGNLQAPLHDANGITCSACHDPHNSENPHQLRLAGSFTFDSGHTYANPGLGGLCMNCHNSRVSNVNNTSTGSFRGAHHGPQGDMLRGINAADFGLSFVGNSAHTTIVEDTCVTCHMAEGFDSGPGVIEPPLVGEHTFSLRDVGNPADPNDDIINAENTCARCHEDLTDTYDLASRGDYDGDGVVEGVQTEVNGLLTLLRTGILANFPGTALEADGTISISAGNFALLTADQKRARYNYNFVVDDGSFGVHNTSYTVQTLQRSYFGVYGRSILEDFPQIDLRGPVQPASIPPPSDPTATPIAPPPATSAAARIEVRTVSPRDVATDQSGLLDEVASGLKAVGLNSKVFLQEENVAPDVTSFQWSVITRPTGSIAPLSSTTDPLVTFRPDRPGRYVIRLNATTSGGANTNFDQVLYAGDWVGVGIFNTHETPTPRAPECATSFCHGGSNAEQRLGVTSEWIKSNHAQKLQLHLGGERGEHYAESCLPCHTVGFDANPLADNNGFDDIAEDIAYDLSQIADLVHDAAVNGVDNWPQLPAELQGHASVQCESCHGMGSQHLTNLLASDHGIDGTDLGFGQCAQCHDSASGFQQGFYEWNASSHPVTAESAEGRVTAIGSCVKCHTGEGFVDVHVNGLPGEPKPGGHGITCAACHDPHFSENPHQLRIVDDFELDSGDRSFAAGIGGVCYRCHNSRVSNAENTALNSFRGAHHGPQADMMLGVNGVSFGLAFEENSAHTVVVPDSCSSCHMTEGIGGGPGQTTPPLVGGHTFALRDPGADPDDPSDDITNHENACASCHFDIASLDYASKGDYDGDGAIEGTQSEVAGLFDILRPGILANFPGVTLNDDGTISTTSGNFGSLTDNQKRALYNYNFVWEDGSLGVHNTSYAVQLLQRSYFGVYGRPINVDFPEIDLRGPVQDPVSVTASLVITR